MNIEPLRCERREKVGGLIPVTGVELISDKDKNRPRPVDSDVKRIADPSESSDAFFKATPPSAAVSLFVSIKVNTHLEDKVYSDHSLLTDATLNGSCINSSFSSTKAKISWVFFSFLFAELKVA